MALLLPKFAEQYVSDTLERRERFIAHQIWGDLSLADLRRWWANFTTADERYFAACVLDGLIYRSESQSVALARHLYQRCIPDVIRLNPSSNSLVGNCLGELQQGDRRTPRVLLCPVICGGDPPTKSGFITSRLLKRHLRVDEYFLVNPPDLKGRCTANTIVIFVDDFLGTGHQFEGFIDSHNLQSLLDDHYCIYAPLAAHDLGIQHLEGKFKNLKVTTADHLTAAHHAFHPTKHLFDDLMNSAETARAFYDDFAKAHGLPVDDNLCGYGDLGLVYAFSHSVPDNSLPLLWWGRSATFMPLFNR